MQLQKFLKAIDTLSEWSGRIFIWIVIPLTVVVAFEVIARRVFGAPHIWATEVTNYLYGSHFMLVAGYTLLHRAHVSIDIIYGSFRPRVRGFLDLFTYCVFFFPFCIIMLYQGTIFAHSAWMAHETSQTAALTVVPHIKTVIPITFALLLIQGLASFIRGIMLIVRGEEV